MPSQGASRSTRTAIRVRFIGREDALSPDDSELDVYRWTGWREDLLTHVRIVLVFAKGRAPSIAAQQARAKELVQKFAAVQR